MRNPAYALLSTVYNFPINSTLNQYDTLDSNTEHGILHQNLADMQHDFEKNNIISNKSQVLSMWQRYGVLKFDEMKVKEKIVFNPHTH